MNLPEMYIYAGGSFLAGVALLLLLRKMKHPLLGLFAFCLFGTEALCVLAISFLIPN